jgi:prepilin-type N-terminal cleavage/methylation domain-containing protein
MKIRNSQKGGFTLVEIMIVVAIIGLLAAIAIPNFVRARTTSQMNACINNLRQIDGAKQQWALETKQQGTTAPTYAQISAYMKSAVICPAGGSTATTFGASYDILAVDVRPTCKVLPATHALPADTSS